MTEEEKHKAAEQTLNKPDELSSEEKKSLRRVAAEADILIEVAAWWRRFKGAIAVGGLFAQVGKWFLVIGALLAMAKAGLLSFIGIEGGQ